MARLRVVKVEYWLSEHLATACPGPDGREARRFFIGMWNLAEDHGVCRANPVWLRGQLYPYDLDVTPADIERWLAMLEAGGFIVRYSHKGSSLAFIVNFLEHQKIDRPSKPTLPLPEDSSSARRVLVEASIQPPEPRREHSPPDTTTRRDETSTSRNDYDNESAPEQVASAVVPEGQATATDPPKPADAGARRGAEELLREGWNRHATLRQCLKLTPERVKAARAALKRRPLAQWLDEIFPRIADSPFCRGENDSGWAADFDWAIRPGSARKSEPAQCVLEGKYDARGPPPEEAPKPCAFEGCKQDTRERWVFWDRHYCPAHYPREGVATR